MRVLIAGDDADVDRMMKLIAEPPSEIVVVGQVNNEGALFNAARLLHPDVILLEPALHPRSSEEWLDYLRLISGGALVITVTNSA